MLISCWRTKTLIMVLENWNMDPVKALETCFNNKLEDVKEFEDY